MRDSVKLILPFAVWMVLMKVLPNTAVMYATRAVITAGLLVWSLWGTKINGKHFKRAISWGVPIGVLVLAIWIAPEHVEEYKKYCIIGEGGTNKIAEANAGLLVMRLLGSAFVIAIAEELFFRKWLIRFAGFWWMTALFAIEHDRFLVGAIAGIIYGWIYLRKGLGAAIIAHVTTNFLLGLYVIYFNEWQLW